MATAVHAEITKTRMVQQEYQVPVVQLNLSQKEAEFLSFLCGCVGGSVAYSPRAFAATIRNALNQAGITNPQEYNAQALIPDRRALYFKSVDQFEYEGGESFFLDTGEPKNG
jgi:hypothetical protein